MFLSNDTNQTKLDIFLLENLVWIAQKPIDSPRYDFNFRNFFACRHPWQRPEMITAVGRFGVIPNYEKIYQQLHSQGIQLIHTPDQYQLTSDLTQWYPLLSDLTPQSIWFETPPSASEIEKHFSYPIFVKGSRQTNRHLANLSIIRNREQYEWMTEQYRNNPILHWQPLVCREYINLRRVSGSTGDKIPPAFEFRTFWWYSKFVGAGPYWAGYATYQWSPQEEAAALKVAQEAAIRLNVPFLVIDVAQKQDGQWLVIECNDAQESGYTGVVAIALWQNIIDAQQFSF